VACHSGEQSKLDSKNLCVKRYTWKKKKGPLKGGGGQQGLRQSTGLDVLGNLGHVEEGLSAMM